MTVGRKFLNHHSHGRSHGSSFDTCAIIKKIAYLLLIMCMVPRAAHADGQGGCCPGSPQNMTPLHGTSMFNPRSQGTNDARDLCCSHRYMHQAGEGLNYGLAEITLEYMQSFRPTRLAEYFFGVPGLIVSGSTYNTGVPFSDGTGDSDFIYQRESNAFLADYFGLSPAFFSTICMKPVMKNGIADFSFFVGIRSWYFTFHMPLVWAATQFHLYENVEDNGASVEYPALYMGPNAFNAPYRSFDEAILGVVPFGQVEALKYGKITGCPLKTHGIADIHMALGYDIIRQDTGYLGFNARLVAPTGTVPHAEFLFEPIIGNGHHWEFGFGFSGGGMIWEKGTEQRLELLCDFNLTHFFGACQRRAFDFFCNGFGSRYILVKEFDEQGNYTGTTLPAINLTTLGCKVSNAAQIDTVIMFAYRKDNFGFDIGWNGWLRTHDSICITQESPFARGNYGFKGLANAVGNSTESTATLWETSSTIDDPSPVFITPDSINPQSAASPLAFTNKIFFCFSHYGHQRETRGVNPYFCFAGEFEFEGVQPKNTLPNKDAMAQWGLFVKGGIAW